ncbi:MarR family transcriptional regulator [Arthrobacter sp. EH-1B-1]|uniref:MarR family transcriptional regulator n=1 Tax=Arthrobacter vasquezii TaxID=2977629 RepID=A0ABT6CWS7_9MICC|nr:MarR family transcriptional regulator [Arthrobacter vasquezii]MDF9278483.1 MarR family transcriptional regulator [Arthrobacter vasquezii]
MPDTDLWTTERMLTTAARLTENAWNERLHALGITHAAFITLRTVEAHGPLSQVELADHLHVTAQTVGRTLARLEQQGLVYRHSSESDRRTFVVSLTEPGRSLLSEAERHEREFALDLQRASPELRRLLMKVIEDLLPARFPPNGVEQAGQNS